MTGETLAIAPAREDTDLKRAQIDLARVELLDEMDVARERLNEASLAAALPGGSDTAMLEAEQEVNRLAQLLQGLAHGVKQLDAREQERKAADDLVNRRARAVRLSAYIHRRFWKTQDLDQALAAIGKIVGDIDELGEMILLETGGMSESDRSNFLLNLDCFGMSDTVVKFNANGGSRAGHYARGLPMSRAAALRAGSKAIPELLDDEVKAEALALARRDEPI